MMVRINPARRVSLADLVRASGKDCIEAQQAAKPGLSELADTVLKAKNTHGAVFAEVKIDEELPILRVTRVLIAVAAGRIINPKTARSQVIGGAVMAIGMALHEETVMDHRLGRFMTHNFADYHIPVNADIPEIEVIFVNEPDTEVSPLGVKGVGGRHGCGRGQRDLSHHRQAGAVVASYGGQAAWIGAAAEAR
jgi:xanthine dehydrogenase YagR molybdenum-binding subunit